MKGLFCALFILFTLNVYSQREESVLQDSISKPDLTLEKKLKEVVEAAPLKKKKNVYYGEKVKPSFTRTNARGKIIIEEFNYLKEPTRADKFVRTIFSLERVKGNTRIVKSKPSTKPFEQLLHGPYRKFQDNVLIEEGMFFYGTKHERWLTTDTKGRLLKKEHYHKGWYRDSDISHYDLEKQSKLQEVVPVQYGKREGPYYYFFENGRMAIKGQYEFDKRVGIWEEYYDAARTTIKREIQYPKDPFDPTPPFIRKEWDERGNTIYTSPKIRRSR